MKRYSKTNTYKEHDFVNVEDPKGLDCSVLPSRTAQEFREEVDINTIAERYRLTGELPVNVPQVLEADFENVSSFQEAMNLVVAARESFDAMPAAVRAEYHNSAEEFVRRLSDPEEYATAERLGLVRPEVQAARKAAAEVAEAKRVEDAAAALIASRKAQEDQSST